MIDFSVWVDADSCPIPVKDIIFRFCKRLSLKLIFVANHQIPMPKSELFKMIVCDATPDAADNYIVENALPNDIVITRDIPMASRLLDKNITTINDRGLLFTSENIKEKLSLRNFNKELYDNGILSEKTSTFSKKDVNNFANCFDREIQKKLKTN
ncbi:MAG: YaiI/YqxD family protein [Treponemataceae bacterium]|nr:YaiI/YqxD family protein [Treponemataceae bacterium]